MSEDFWAWAEIWAFLAVFRRFERGLGAEWYSDTSRLEPMLRRRLFAFWGMVGREACFLPSVLDSEDENIDCLGRVENFRACL
jgi:hypothetical protein